MTQPTRVRAKPVVSSPGVDRDDATESEWLAASPALKEKLAKLDLHCAADVVLHLPLRYEDHTRVYPLAAVVPGKAWQVEGTITAAEIQYRPRRTLVCHLQE